ncbi:MAG TPA: DUF2157 domain-containing protein, partial [Chloroflexaceae bacterium]|nr:DUF2157 domain-containing protein [Chloroflexaceae bacterium]
MNPLDQPATPERLRRLASQGLLSPATLERALAAAGHLPMPPAWARFFSRALLVLGAAFTLAGTFFFFAYNWDDLHRFVKLGLLAGAVAATGGFALWRGLERSSGQVALFAACALIGALLAVFGQVYQTGADSFALFLSWAAMIVVPTLLARNGPLWMLLLALLNLSLGLFLEQRVALAYDLRPTALFALNAAWAIGWELGRGRAGLWMRSPWYRRAGLAVAAFWGTATALELITQRWVIRDGELYLLVGALAALGLGGAAAVYYRWRSPDLPALSLLALCAIFLVTAQVSEWLGWSDAGHFPVLGAPGVAPRLGAAAPPPRAARRREGG